VKSHLRFACIICIAVTLLFLPCGYGWGVEPPAGEVVVEHIPTTAEDTDDSVETVLPEESAPQQSLQEPRLVGEASAGYRFYHVDGNGGRAEEYKYLRSNPEMSGFLNYLGLDNKFVMDGNLFNDRDYMGDLTYDHKGIYRFNLRTESLFHNLDHERLFSPSPFTTTSGALYDAIDRNPGDSYGVRVEQDLASFRYKFPLYPFHLNLEYWRMVREGTIQQRFADQAFEGTQNTIYSQSRKIDRETHEGSVVFDTHLGVVDLIYGFKIRQFGDHNGPPRDAFIARTDPTLLIQHNAGVLPHDETPDSRFYEHTVKLHTSLSGGIVGVASYTYAKRENLSSMGDIRGADQSSDTMHNVAGDFTYTPCGFFSMALKYRRQEVDRDAPDSLTSTNPAYTTSTFTVRPAIDTEKDTVTATLSFLPIRSLTIKGEYKGEFLSRDNLDAWNRPGTTGSMSLPDSVNIHKGTLTLLSRPFRGLRIKAQYSYSTADNAMYGNAFEQRHQGSLLVTYNAPARWGVTANTRIVRESSDHLTISSLDISSPSVTLQLPRERRLENATFSIWFTPVRNLTISGSYGLLRNKTEQGVLFAGTVPGSDYPADFTSQAQVYSLSAVYAPVEKLDLSLVLQQVRSFSRFAPGLVDAALSSEIQGISQAATRENSLSVRGEYQLTKNLSCVLDYSYRDYDDKSQGLLSGTVHTVSANVRAKW
jgi:hypothetical protein